MHSEKLTIRRALRLATDDLHSALDRDLGALQISDRAAYAAFLAVQFAARRPVELWQAAHAPDNLIPPVVTDLIAEDLTALGHRTDRLTWGGFHADPAGALGVAWAIGGSSMGNQVMLRRLHSVNPALPAAFLGDDRMTGFFADLRPSLEQPADSHGLLDEAIAAARGVFALFADSFARFGRQWDEAA